MVGTFSSATGSDHGAEQARTRGVNLVTWSYRNGSQRCADRGVGRAESGSTINHVDEYDGGKVLDLVIDF